MKILLVLLALSPAPSFAKDGQSHCVMQEYTNGTRTSLEDFWIAVEGPSIYESKFFRVNFASYPLKGDSQTVDYKVDTKIPSDPKVFSDGRFTVANDNASGVFSVGYYRSDVKDPIRWMKLEVSCVRPL